MEAEEAAPGEAIDSAAVAFDEIAFSLPHFRAQQAASLVDATKTSSLRRAISSAS